MKIILTYTRCIRLTISPVNGRFLRSFGVENLNTKMSRLLVFEWERLEVYQSACQNFARSEASHLPKDPWNILFYIFYSLHSALIYFIFLYIRNECFLLCERSTISILLLGTTILFLAPDEIANLRCN